MATIQTLTGDLQARLEQLDAERDRITAALAALTGARPTPEPEPEPDPAPLGYRADGQPRKRRAPRDPDYAKRGHATRRRRAAEQAAAAPARVDLRVLSSTHPTQAELRDRDLVHTTEAPADRNVG